MSFIWPGMLLSLLLIPVLVVIYLRIQRRRQRYSASFGGLGLAKEAEARPLKRRRNIPSLLFIAGLAILMLAMARPQAVVSLPKVEGTVILAFDVSGSMAAEDMKPTRMEAAKTAAQDFIKSQPLSVQIGVVAFSDSGFSVQPPTNDQGAILAAVNRLSPERGTSLANGILVSLKAIADANSVPAPRFYSNATPQPTPTPTPVPQGTYSSSVIVLFTDGENNENPDPLQAAQQAAERGVRIYTVGLGSPAGTTLHVNGFTVHTQLNEDLLKQISQISGGTYFNAQSQEDLAKIYDNITSQLVIKPEKTELTSILAGAGVLILAIAGTFSIFWFNRLP
jgi:Ca-activated chloride channel family protein